MADNTRIGILGGSFDPLHNGHLAIAEIALKELALDKVFLVPTARVSYKDSLSCDPNHRLVMCRLGIAGIPGLYVDDCDIRRSGDTFTVDTLRDFGQRYPSSTLYFIMGSDSLESFDIWKQAEALGDMAQFAVVKRGDCKLSDEELLASCRALPAHKIILLAERGPEISSTEIRQYLSAVQDGTDKGKKSPSEIELPLGHVPQKVLDYMAVEGLYGMPKRKTPACEAFEPEFLSARRADLEARVSEHRLEHILGVAETSRELAELYGEDARAAYLAGLLHDWDKNYNDEQIRQRCDDLGVEVDPEVYRDMPYVLHGFTAATWLGGEFPEIPTEVLRAVRLHTTGSMDMTPLDMIVYIADSLEPHREFSGIVELRAMVGKCSLEELFCLVHGTLISTIIRRKKMLVAGSLEIWNHYASRCFVQRRDLSKPDKVGNYREASGGLETPVTVV